jgi:hypothetical protein
VPPVTADNMGPPPVDPALLRPAPPREAIQVWAVPGCDPADRPVGPGVCKPSVPASRLELEEQQILAAQGRASYGAVGVDVLLGDQGASRRNSTLRAEVLGTPTY